MKCEKFMQKFMERDDYSSMGLRMKLHVLKCSRCRDEVKMLNHALAELRDSESFYPGISVSDSVMSAIERRERFKESRITGIKWGLIGSVIFFSLFLINFSDSFIWLKAEFGADLTVPVSIVLGSVFSLYALIVTGINYQSMKSVIDYYLKKL